MFAAQRLPHLRRWPQGNLGSDLFQSIMVRAPLWNPGDLPTQAAAVGIRSITT